MIKSFFSFLSSSPEETNLTTARDDDEETSPESTNDCNANSVTLDTDKVTIDSSIVADVDCTITVPTPTHVAHLNHFLHYFFTILQTEGKNERISMLFVPITDHMSNTPTHLMYI